MHNNATVQLEVTNLCKYYKAGKKKVLKAVDDISFVIYKGETLGIVGESGCGKTTSGKTCIGMLQPTSGQVKYQGKDVHHMTKKERFDFTGKVQMIFQDPYASLDPHQKVYDIVAEGIRIHKLASSREQEEKMVLELLDMVGLNAEHAMRNVHEFSGGQRQRIGIARALAVNPEFLFCDEPISALDVSIQAQIINLLIKLQKERDLTMLFIAHDLSMVKHISDRIAVMYLGNMVELSPPLPTCTSIRCTPTPRRCCPRCRLRTRRPPASAKRSCSPATSLPPSTRRLAAASADGAASAAKSAAPSARNSKK